MTDIPVTSDLCVNACLYNEDKGCLPGAQANADKCFVESLGRRIMEVEAFIRQEAAKLPPEPPPGKKPEPDKKPPEPRQAAAPKPPEAAKAAEPTKPAEPAQPIAQPPAVAQPPAAAQPAAAAESGTAAMSGDASSSPLPMSLRRKPEDIPEE